MIKIGNSWDDNISIIHSQNRSSDQEDWNDYNSTGLPYQENVWDRYPTWNAFFAVHSPSMVFFRRYLPILWYSLGVPGNILAFSVWIQPRMRTSSGLYLATGAIVDLIVNCIKIGKTLQSHTKFYLYDIKGLCQIIKVLDYTLQYSHPLLILGFTVERCIAVCHPFKRSKYCTISRALKITALLLGFAFAVALAQAYFWHVNQRGFCDYRRHILIGGLRSVLSVWNFTTESLMFVIVPMATLGVNIHVIYVLHNTRNKRMKKLNSRVHQHSKSHYKSTTTVTLLATSFFNIFTELAVTVVYVIYPLYYTGDENMPDNDIREDPTWQTFIAYKSIQYAIYNICWSRYALNFYIYLVTGQTFREELKRMMCKKVSSQKRQRSISETKITFITSTT